MGSLIEKSQNNTKRDRVRGLFLGTAIGDALGMPAETWSKKQIAEKYGVIKTYLGGHPHKWNDGTTWIHEDAREAGTWTDDTQLFLAIAKAIIDKGKIDLPSIASRHVEAMVHSIKGWGKSTRDSVANLAAGASWKDSATGTGVGNGVCMKIAPLGVFWAVKPTVYKQAMEDAANLAMMTHKTSIAVSSGLAHAGGICRILLDDHGMFSQSHFIRAVTVGSQLGEKYLPETIKEDRLTQRLEQLVDARTWDDDKIIENYGAGACYCFHSLPFTYAFFLRNPHSIESLYSVIGAGGDTDSNGSMLGGLLGAVNGTSIFPQNLVDGLHQKDEVLQVADQFCDKLGITE
jgi:ADP-ribosylglycohydrolase